MISAKFSSPRLSSALLADLPLAIDRPRYDRGLATAGIVHLGLGAFARAHLAAYTEDALNAGDLRWGILGANLNSTEVADALAPQDFLYSLLTRDVEENRVQVIGSVLGAVSAKRDPRGVLEALVRPETRIVGLTVTEKGYCLGGDGALDERHPGVLADLASPRSPQSVPGILVEALRLRREAGTPPFAVLSLDNLAQNGVKTRAVAVQFAERLDSGFGRFIADEVAFPSTMVDRIVPATSDEDCIAVEKILKLADAAPVVSEPFRQWVVEDRFPLGRPRWEEFGALMTSDVTPYENMKLRCLNGAHSTLAYLGVCAGVETVSEAMALPGFVEILRRLWRQDVLPTLRAVPGAELSGYTRLLEVRFRNPWVRHRVLQISADGSQKLPPRLIGTALDRLRVGAQPQIIPLSIAAWMRFLLGRSDAGEIYGIVDPLAQRLTTLAQERAGSAKEMAGALLAVREIFPAELAETVSFRSDVEKHLDVMLRRGTSAAITAALAQ